MVLQFDLPPLLGHVLEYIVDMKKGMHISCEQKKKLQDIGNMKKYKYIL